MATGTIATRTGTMIVPGVSLNRRLYTKELIGKAVARMQERIAAPDGLPIVMRTHHGAGDDSGEIVGKVTDVTVNDAGVARWSAQLYDTPEGRTIATLSDPKDPALKSTSIYGFWLGPVKRVSYEGQMVETGDDLEIDAIDFTASPGVVQAQLDGGSTAGESAGMRTPISESYAADTVTEAKDPKKPYGDVKYADPGYQKDGKKRYPIDTKDHVKAAWSYINQAKNASPYTAAQVKAIKGRIKAAAKKLGIDISSDESRLIDRFTMPATEAVREFYGDDSARFCVSVSNGPIDVVISSYCINPADLDVVARAAMDGACQALALLDPDNDGDIDVPGMDSTEGSPDVVSPDDDMETTVTVTVAGGVWDQETLVAALQTEARRRGINTTPQATPTTGGDNNAPTTEGKPTVSGAPENNEATTTAAPTAPAGETTTAAGKTTSLTAEDITAIVSGVGSAFAAALKEHAAAVTPAPAAAPAPTQQAPATETQAPAATESTTKVDEGAAVKEAVTAALGEMRTELTKAITAEVDKVRAETRDVLVAAGIGTARAGFRAQETAGADGERSPEQLFDDRANVLLGNWAATPVPHAGTGLALTPTTQAPAAK